MTFPGLEFLFQNSMTFPGFHDLYEPCFNALISGRNTIVLIAAHLTWTRSYFFSPSKLSHSNEVLPHLSYLVFLVAPVFFVHARPAWVKSQMLVVSSWNKSHRKCLIDWLIDCFKSSLLFVLHIHTHTHTSIICGYMVYNAFMCKVDWISVLEMKTTTAKKMQDLT